MRRLARYTLNALTALSLLLCVATVALWVRSYWHYDSWVGNGPNRTQRVASVRGRLFRSRQTAPGVTSVGTVTLKGPPPGFHSVAASPATTDSIIDSYPNGFAHIRVASPLWGTTSTDMVPHWSIVLLAALTPVLWTLLPAPRPPAGLCPRCRYDLRATPDRCPECGREVGGA